MKLTEYLHIFLKWNQSGPRSKYDYSCIVRYWVSRVGDCELSEASQKIYTFFDSYNNVDPTTYNNYRRRLRAIFASAKTRGLILNNPCDLIPAKRPITEEGGLLDEHEVKTIPFEVIKAILNNIYRTEKIRYALAIHLLAETGARPIEVCRLRKENLNENCVYFKITKTGNPRYVYFPTELADNLRTFTRSEAGIYLLPSESGRIMRPDYLTKVWYRNAEGYRTPDNPEETIKLYWLRHTKAVQLFNSLPLPIAAKTLGMSINTANRYFGFTRKHAREVWAITHNLSYLK
jgi:integrase